VRALALLRPHLCSLSTVRWRNQAFTGYTRHCVTPKREIFRRIGEILLEPRIIIFFVLRPVSAPGRGRAAAERERSKEIVRAGAEVRTLSTAEQPTCRLQKRALSAATLRRQPARRRGHFQVNKDDFRG
jgi:hypothetical protein